MSQVTIDDSDGAIAYGGAWAQITAPSGGNIYQDTITSTNYAGSTARYSFQGGSLTVYAVVTSCQSGSQATAQITIDVDGASNDVSLSCTPATRFNQVVYSGNNPQGNHRLTITYRGGDHPFSLDRLVYTSGGGDGGGGSPQPPPSPTSNNPTTPQNTNDGSNPSGGSISATTTSGRTSGSDSSTTATGTNSGTRSTTSASLQSGSTDALFQATTRFIGGPLATDSNGMPIPTDGSHSGNSNNGIGTSSNDQNTDGGHSHVPLGAIIGGLLGVIAIMGFVIIFLILRRRRRRRVEDMETRAKSRWSGNRDGNDNGKGKMEMDALKFNDSKGFEGDDSALGGRASDSDDTGLSLDHDEGANGIQLANHETSVTGTDERRNNRMTRRREETPRPFTLLPSADTSASGAGGGFLGPALGMGAAGAVMHGGSGGAINRFSEKGGAASSSRHNTNLTTNRRPDSDTSWNLDAVPLYQARRESALSGAARSSAAYTYVTLDPAASHSNSNNANSNSNASSSNAGPSSPTMMTDTSLVYTDYSPPPRGHQQPTRFSTLFGLEETNVDQRQLHHMSDPPEYEEVMGGGAGGGSGGSRDHPFGPAFGTKASEKR